VEKTTLTEAEKIVLRLSVTEDVDKMKELLSPTVLETAAESLKRKGLVNTCIECGHGLFDINITNAGLAYLEVNPELENPTPETVKDRKVAIIGIAVGATIGILGAAVAYYVGLLNSK